MKLQYYPESEHLLRESEPVERFDSELRDICDAMLLHMYEWSGCGLAAPQVGINKQIFVLATSGVQYAVINPRLEVDYHTTLSTFEEGCLSLPGIYADIERPETVKMVWYNVDGTKTEKVLKGFEARVVQHEYDHLHGWLFPFYLIKKPRPRVIKPWEYRKLNMLDAVNLGGLHLKVKGDGK